VVIKKHTAKPVLYKGVQYTDCNTTNVIINPDKPQWRSQYELPSYILYVI